MILDSYVEQVMRICRVQEQGFHGQEKKSGKRFFFQVREKSTNFDISQGNLEKNGKSQGISKFPFKWYG